MDMSSSDDIIFMDIDVYIMSILTRNKISSYDINKYVCNNNVPVTYNTVCSLMFIDIHIHRPRLS